VRGNLHAPRLLRRYAPRNDRGIHTEIASAGFASLATTRRVVSLRAPERCVAISAGKFQITKSKYQIKSKYPFHPDIVGTNPNAYMPKLSLPINVPLKLRGMQGVISIIFITPPPAKEFVRRAGLAPLILRGGILDKFGETQMRPLPKCKMQNDRATVN